MNTTRLSTPYFPAALIYISPFITVLGAYFIFDHAIVWGVAFILTGVIIWTTKYSTEINLDKKEFNDYLFFLGLKLNHDTGTFTGIDKIIITKGNYAYSANTRTRSRTVQFSDYSATLLFADGQALDLFTITDKRKLIIHIKDMANFLKTDIEDNTSSSPYVIDLNKI